MESLYTLRSELEASGRYPWLAARTVYAEGQTFYRQGKIYKAADSFRTAQEGLRRTHDAAGGALMHSLLVVVGLLLAVREPACIHAAAVRSKVSGREAGEMGRFPSQPLDAAREPPPILTMLLMGDPS